MKWEYGGYDVHFKEKVVAWYNLHRLVESHENDAQSEYIDRESRKKS